MARKFWMIGLPENKTGKVQSVPARVQSLLHFRNLMLVAVRIDLMKTLIYYSQKNGEGISIKFTHFTLLL
jgi:hypothetical protein